MPYIGRDTFPLCSRELWIEQLGFRISDRIKVAMNHWIQKINYERVNPVGHLNLFEPAAMV